MSISKKGESAAERVRPYVHDYADELYPNSLDQFERTTMLLFRPQGNSSEQIGVALAEAFMFAEIEAAGPNVAADEKGLESLGNFMERMENQIPYTVAAVCPLSICPTVALAILYAFLAFRNLSRARTEVSKMFYAHHLHAKFASLIKG